MDSRTCRDIQNNKAWSNRPRPDTYGAASIRFPLCWKCAILCLFTTEVGNYRNASQFCSLVHLFCVWVLFLVPSVLRFICSASHLFCVSFILRLIYSASHLFRVSFSCVSFFPRLICTASYLFRVSFVQRLTNKNMYIEIASHPLFSIKSLIQIGYTIYPIHGWDFRSNICHWSIRCTVSLVLHYHRGCELSCLFFIIVLSLFWVFWRRMLYKSNQESRLDWVS